MSRVPKLPKNEALEVRKSAYTECIHWLWWRSFQLNDDALPEASAVLQDAAKALTILKEQL